jgi:hypothetical protein
MMKKMALDSDYLLSSFDHVTATGLSHLPDVAISQDKITCLMSGN